MLQFQIFVWTCFDHDLASSFVLCCCCCCCYYYYYYYYIPLESAVNIGTRPGLGNQGIAVRFPAGTRDLFYSTAFRPALGPAQPPIHCVSGTVSPGLQADHSPPSSTEVKNTWSWTSTLPYVFMACCLNKSLDIPRMFLLYNLSCCFGTIIMHIFIDGVLWLWSICCWQSL
jgi:hypothetical protein